MAHWSRTTLAGLVWSLAALGCTSPRADTEPPPDGRFALIPQPAELTAGDGELRLDAGTRIALSDPASEELRRIAELWAAPLRRASGLPLPVAAEAASPDDANSVRLVLTASDDGAEPPPGSDDELFGDESYDLIVETSSRIGLMTDQSEMEVLVAARDWRAEGHGVALATVVKTWGSSPRPAGSHLVVRDDGFFLGSVSGGCVEGAVVDDALGVMKTGLPKVLEFSVTNEQAWEVGLACGGTVRIFVEPVQ